MSKLVFKGDDSLQGTIPEIPKGSYVIYLIIKDKDLRMSFSPTKTTPPMPANIGGWAIMKKRLDSYFIFNSQNEVGTNIKFEFGQKNTIKIHGDKQRNHMNFYLNGDFVSNKKGYVPLKSFYRLGIGYEERKWIGIIYGLKISEIENGNESVILNLEMD